jgi:hypothetical protein
MINNNIERDKIFDQPTITGSFNQITTVSIN